MQRYIIAVHVGLVRVIKSDKSLSSFHQINVIDKSINQSINRSINQLIDQLINQSIDQSIDRFRLFVAVLQVAHGATINCGGDTEPERGPGPVYDAVEVEEVHSGTTEEDLGTGDYNDDAMALTEIETDTGLELAYDGGAAKTPPAVSFQAGLSRRQRSQPVTEVENVPQEAPQKSRRGQRRFRKNRLANNGVREREEGKTDPPLRPFQMKWLLLYPWLRYEIATKFMHCAWCMESGKKNAFGKNGGKVSLFSLVFSNDNLID